MAPLAEKPPAAGLGVQEPMIVRQGPRVDSHENSKLIAVRAQRFERPRGRGRKATIEAHHQAPLRGANRGRDAVQLRGGQRERLLDEDRLVGAERGFGVARMGIVTRRDEDDFGALIGQGGLGGSTS